MDRCCLSISGSTHRFFHYCDFYLCVKKIVSDKIMNSNSANTHRIAKNTFVLYIRMLFLMIVHLYTSRIILQVLGVEDFGIYNVVGGFVAMFAILSQSLSAAASRFFNYEMAKDDRKKLSDVFSTTLIIHIALAMIIAVLGEAAGVWFVNQKLVLPADRLYAANWVFQLSVLTFCLNLITVPYHASIIAHERMSVFAYISIFEGISSLMICFLLYFSPLDRLILYSILMFLIRVFVMMMNRLYCKRHFPESSFHMSTNMSIYKEIFGFASWNMIGSSAGILRNQGGNILLNLFFGPIVNAARAIANQVLRSVNSFVDNFMVAVNPQITKSYSSGDYDYMMTLIYKGSRYNYYMLLMLCLPILINTNKILHIWLKAVPEHSVIFVQFTLIFAMIESVSKPLVTAQLATGNIRNYQLVVGGINLLNIPVSYILFKYFNMPPEVLLYIAILFSTICLFARIIMLKRMIEFYIKGYVVRVLLNLLTVSVVAIILPVASSVALDDSFIGLMVSLFSCILCSLLSIIFIGLSRAERSWLYSKCQIVFQKNIIRR